MLHILPSVDDVADYAARLSSRLGLHKLGSGEPRIRLSRFAGPLSHHERLGHVRVAHLTDQHFGHVTPAEVQHEAVRLANAQRPDLVVITGDFVCHTQLHLDELRDALGRIDAPALAVLGNHDHWSGAAEVRHALKQAGVELLDNAHTVIEVGGDRLQVVGVDDAYTGHSDIGRAVKGLRADLPAIGLSHIAEEADELWARGVPLVLSGHTHGGQITLARLHEFWLGHVGGHRYVHGLYGSRHDQPPATGAVYVSAGIGSGVMPIRAGERGQREIAVFELGHAPGTIAEDHREQEPLSGRNVSQRKRLKRARKVERNRLRRERRARRRR